MIHGEDVQSATLNALGSQKHFAMQNEAAEVDYVRYLSETILPLVLPPQFIKCRYVSGDLTTVKF